MHKFWQDYCAARDAFTAAPSAFLAVRAIKLFEKWAAEFCPIEAHTIIPPLRLRYLAALDEATAA